MKPASELLPSDFLANKVWEFANELESETANESCVRPVARLPVDSLGNRLVGTQLVLANGQQRFAILGSVDVDDPVSTEHFLCVTVFRPDGESFDLARYHDTDYPRHDAVALATFLGFPTEAVFPMRYDITGVARGRPECLRRAIPAAPTTKLSKEELIALALG